MVKSEYDVFLSYDHSDADAVEDIGRALALKGIRVWFDKWILVPGQSWQQAMAKGLAQAAACAVCIGKRTARGWFQQEVERALDLQAQDPNYRVIPVLLPDAIDRELADLVPAFASLRT
jgi:hypothetical protein